MPEAHVRIRVPEELRFFLPARRRGGDFPGGDVRCAHDGTSSLGHVVEALGVPLTEVGGLSADGRPVQPSYCPRPGVLIRVEPLSRPQPLPASAPAPPRFVLDVHLGSLARRLRLVGVDTAYRNDADDPGLVAAANAGRRILLTRDRGLLCRRALWLGAYVYGDRPDGQLTDVLTRFDVPLSPWTRCPSCKGALAPVPEAEIAHLLPPGTRRTYDTFTRCAACSRIYWPGAHHDRLARTVAAARAAAARTPPPRPAHSSLP